MIHACVIGMAIAACVLLSLPRRPADGVHAFRIEAMPWMGRGPSAVTAAIVTAVFAGVPKARVLYVREDADDVDIDLVLPLWDWLMPTRRRAALTAARGNIAFVKPDRVACRIRLRRR